MKRALSLVALIAALAACDNSQPAGGRGYFDPPPPAPFNPGPGFAPATTATTTMPGAPMSALGPQTGSEDEALARDVAAALAATGGGGTAQPGAGQPAAGQPVAPGQPMVRVGEIVIPGETGIDPNADSINLALQSQEEQIRQRAVAQQEREAARQQLVIVEPEPVPQQDINANVVRFARETTHPVGTKRYNRPPFRDRMQSASNCRGFANAEEAQRQFLANGGPQTDRYNLDPDGDGFACDFDPERYRRLNF